jgi:hypothetical protein
LSSAVRNSGMSTNVSNLSVGNRYAIAKLLLGALKLSKTFEGVGSGIFLVRIILLPMLPSRCLGSSEILISNCPSAVL